MSTILQKCKQFWGKKKLKILTLKSTVKDSKFKSTEHSGDENKI